MNYGLYPPNSGRVINAQLKVLIADITLTNTGSFEAIPIPGGFDHLELRAALRSTASAIDDDTRLYFNANTTDSNYSVQVLLASGASTASARADTGRAFYVPGSTSTAGLYGTCYAMIAWHAQPGLTRTSRLYTALRNDATNQAIFDLSHNWESTEPITSITLRTDNHPTDLFAAGSRVQIFGLGTFAVALAR